MFANNPHQAPFTFRIHVSQAQELVDVQLHGLMTVAEVDAYIAELKCQLTAHKLSSYAMVIDVTDCLIQSQDMIRAMAVHMTTMPKARALAVVTSSSLARLQIRRLFTQPYARVTATIAEGRAWVLWGSEPTAP